MSKRRKKSLVGWTYTLWQEHFFFDIGRIGQKDVELLEIPSIRFRKSLKNGSEVKVRITIQEFK